MINYKWLLISIILPLYNIIIFSTIVLSYKYYNNLKEENTIISKKILFLISFFDYFNNFLYLISYTNISYFLSLILSRLILIILMVLNYIFVKRRYRYNHYIGVFFTIIGIIFLLIGNTNNNNNTIYVIINILSVFMNSMSNFFTEKYIKINEQTNVFWMNMWTSFFFLIIGLFFFPIILIPSVGKYIDSNLNIYEIDNYLTNGFSCYLLGKDNISDYCNYAILWISLYEIAIVIMFYLIFYLYKYGSSVYYQILGTLKIPISTFISYYLIKNNIIKVTDNMNFEINMFDYISLIFITLGSIIYIIKKEETEKTEAEIPLIEHNEV
jgi:drug/metabolite transporter (DMT)-like permease